MDIETDVLQCVCLNMRRSARRVTQFYDDMLRPSGLRITQFTILTALDKFSETSINPLAEILGMDRTTLSRNLDLLMEKRLVSFATGERDHRQQVVRLTALGRAMLAKAMPLWKKAQRQVVRQLSKARAGELLLDLEAVSRF